MYICSDVSGLLTLYDGPYPKFIPPNLKPPKPGIIFFKYFLNYC